MKYLILIGIIGLLLVSGCTGCQTKKKEYIKVDRIISFQDTTTALDVNTRLTCIFEYKNITYSFRGKVCYAQVNDIIIESTNCNGYKIYEVQLR